MKKLSFVLSVFLLVSCTKAREKAQELKEKVTGNKTDVPAPAPTPDQLKLSFANLFVNQYSPFLIVPTHMETLVGEKGEVSELYSNLLFFNPESGEINTLDTSYVGFIESFSVITSQAAKLNADGSEVEETGYTRIGKNAPNLIFMEVANSKLQVDSRSSFWNSIYKGGSTSYNRYLAVTTYEGKNFTALTPSNSAVIWWGFIQEGSGFMASAVVDSDNNGKIEDKDQVELFYTNLQKPELGRTVIPAKTKDLLTSDYIKRFSDFEQKSEH